MNLCCHVGILEGALSVPVLVLSDRLSQNDTFISML